MSLKTARSTEPMMTTMKPTTRNRPTGKERQAGQTTLTNFWRPTALQKGRATDTYVTGEWGEGQTDKGLNAPTKG